MVAQTQVHDTADEGFTQTYLRRLGGNPSHANTVSDQVVHNGSI